MRYNVTTLKQNTQQHKEYDQSKSHKNVGKNLQAKGTCMEEKDILSMQFQGKHNPKVTITLEFTGEVEGSIVEEEITSVLMEKYLEKVYTGSVQKESQALSSPARKKGGKTNE